MSLQVTLISGLVLLWLIAYQGASAKSWFSVLSVFLILVSWQAPIHWSLTGLVWMLSGSILFLTWHEQTRKKYLSAKLLKQFRKVLPGMSSTEQAAIDAGSVWWDAQLFSGTPDWDELLAYPAANLTQEERQFLDGPVQELCEKLNDWQITAKDADLSPEAWEFIKQQRFFGMIIPREYGGLDFSALAHSNVVMKLASRSITAAVTVMVPNSLGPAKLLLNYGTQEQKDYYLPRLADGREIPCFALTGPEAGSDAGAIPDKGILTYREIDGKKILGINLTFNKRYITLAPVATLIGLAFKLYDPEHLLGEKTSLGITVALLPRDTTGIDIGNRHVPMNIPFQNGPIRGKDVFISLDKVLGGKQGVGKGWQMLVECLAEGRAISLPALSTGAGKSACRYTGAYAKIRQQFGLPIGQFEGVQEALARIAGYTYQMDAARTLSLSAIDQGEKPSVISAILKYHLTERYRKVMNDAMDIQGGSGICLGPANLIGRAYQSIPIAITVEGANILTRSMIIFGQGAIRCHPWILQEIKAAGHQGKEAVDLFDHALFGHVGFLLSNLSRSFFLGLTRGRFSSTPTGSPTRRYFQLLNWMCAAFALTADITMMTLGGALKRKERLSARLGDVLSELYLSSALLKHFHDQDMPKEVLPLVNWAMHESLYQIQESLRALYRNMPFKPLGYLLRFITFPTGMPFSPPDDYNGKQVANILMEPSAIRDDLTRDVYINDNEQDKVGLLELAFSESTTVGNIESTIQAAKRAGILNGKTLLENADQALAEGVINKDQLQQLLNMHELRLKVIQVDDFKLFPVLNRETEQNNVA